MRLKVDYIGFLQVSKVLEDFEVKEKHFKTLETQCANVVTLHAAVTKLDAARKVRSISTGLSLRLLKPHPHKFACKSFDFASCVNGAKENKVRVIQKMTFSFLFRCCVLQQGML